MKAKGVTKVRINQTECDRILRAPGGPVHREVSQQTRRVETLAKANAPVETGRGRASIAGNVAVKGKVIVGNVGSAMPYMRYQETGTGPIFPRRAQALRFKPKGANFFVFAKKTRGVPATHWLSKALEQGSSWPVRNNPGGS